MFLLQSSPEDLLRALSQFYGHPASSFAKSCVPHPSQVLSYKVKVIIAQSCPTLCDPVDCSPPVSSVHGILQARRLEWVAISFSRKSSQPRDETQVSCIAGRFFTTEAFYKHYLVKCLCADLQAAVAMIWLSFTVNGWLGYRDWCSQPLEKLGGFHVNPCPWGKLPCP